MSERDTFGQRLRRQRERRGISLETIEAATKVGIDLWAGLERNDFSHWPRGIFARAFVRDYARLVGLDADDVVDEFCRLFPYGDRRAARIIKAQAELIGHDPGGFDEQALLPSSGDRRGPVTQTESDLRRWWPQLLPRVLAASIDIVCTLSISAIGGLVGAAFWSSLAVAALVYYSASTLANGSLGHRVITMLRARVPALFAMQNRRAHA